MNAPGFVPGIFIREKAMAGLGWLRTGTITVTNGSKAVTGTDTIWGGGVVNPGDIILLPNGALGEVESVGSNTALTLKQAYAGATASAQPYAIIRMLPSGNVAADLAAQFTATLQRYHLTLDQFVSFLDSTSIVSFSDGDTTITGLHGLRKLMADIDASIKLRDERRIVLGTGADNGVDKLQVAGSASIRDGLSPTYTHVVTGNLSANTWTPLFQGGVMPSGLYLMRAEVHTTAAGGLVYDTTFVGHLYWHAETTNAGDVCEIPTQFSGHALNGVVMKFRTRMTMAGSPGLAIFELHTTEVLSGLDGSGAKRITIKFIRIG